MEVIKLSIEVTECYKYLNIIKSFSKSSNVNLGYRFYLYNFVKEAIKITPNTTLRRKLFISITAADFY